MTLIEAVAVIVSFTGIWLTSKRSMLCWPVCLLGCALYFKIFLDVRLYSDMALQAIFGGALLYGWFAWARDKEDSGEVTIVPLAPKSAMIGLAAGAIGAITIGWATSQFTDASLPWADAALSSFSIVAQYWTARRHTASWLLWIGLDTLYVGMFIVKGLWLTAGLYGAMAVLAMLGYARWRRVLQNQRKEPSLDS